MSTRSKETAVKVFLKFRNNTTNSQDAVKFRSNQQIQLHSSEMKKAGQRSIDYSFDRIWDKEAVQEDVYKQVGQPLLKNVLAGYNSTLFVYGQTGSGKTYTMFGPDGGKMGNPKEGIVPRAMRDLFAATSHLAKKNPSTKYTVSLNIVDVYLEKVRDLLCKNLNKNPDAQNCKVRWHKKNGVYITLPDRSPITSLDVTDYKEVQSAIDFAIRVRRKSGAQAATKMNAYSSRSHFVIICSIKEESPEGIKTSKLLLCDLAGSEKTKNTEATGTTLKQAQNINYGLSVLGNVLNALTSRDKRLPPFSDSKLTKILQDSLGGNCKTSLICGARPDDVYGNETRSTIRFGINARKIKNQVIKNEILTPEQYQRRLAKMAKKEEVLENAVNTLQKQQLMLNDWIGALEDDLTAHGGNIDELAMSSGLKRAKDILSMNASDIGTGSEGEEKTDVFGNALPSIDESVPSRRRGSQQSAVASKFLKTMNKKLTIENRELSEDIKELRNQLRSTETLLHRIEGESIDYQDRIEELQIENDKIKELQGKNYELTRALEQEKQMAKHLNRALETKNNTAMHLEKNVRTSSIATKIETSTAKMHDLQQRLRNKDDKVLIDLVGDLTEQQDEIKKLKSALKEQTEHNRQLMILRKQTANARTGTENQMLTLYGRYKLETTNYETKLSAKDEKIARLEKRIAELTSQRDSMRMDGALSIGKALSRKSFTDISSSAFMSRMNSKRGRVGKKKIKRKIKKKPPTLPRIRTPEGEKENMMKKALASPLA